MVSDKRRWGDRKGRKWHLTTNTLGLMRRIEVHSARVQDRDGAALARLIHEGQSGELADVA